MKYDQSFVPVMFVVGIIMFFICRELFAWYIKRNKQLKNQDEQIMNQNTIIELLKEQNQLLKDMNDINKVDDKKQS